MPDNRNFQGSRGADGKPPPPPVTIGSFYKDGTKNPKDDLFEETARKIAESFFRDKYVCVTKTQIRRLFDEVKRFVQLLDISEEQWEAQKPYIRMISSKASYSIARAIEKNRDAEGVYKNLRDFITQGIKQVHDADDFRVFAALFEAAYGFYYEINHNKD
ncbi:MAG: type III-A CRISPR-associated protein Csm2 [Treponema sp.]|jgi:CRISPR-associated protein Csm2|nr:type III-A CRISPR-associated protein Csm2 [Treponema sp.]